MRTAPILAAVVLAAAVACLRADSGYHCASDTSCASGGAGGTCAAGYCAFPDTTCPSGLRYGASSGTFSNQCVAGVTSDAGAGDAMPDAPGIVAPTFVSAGSAHFGSAATFSFSFTVPPAGANQLLVVSVGMAEVAGTFPAVQSITYGGRALTSFNFIVGTPNNAGTRSEQWRLLAPPPGAADVAVALTVAPKTVHASAMLFAGVNQTTPIRTMASGSGFGSSSSVTIASAPGDLVESWLGYGGAAITGPGSGQTLAYKDDVSSNDSLDNDAGSFAPGAPSVTMSWTETTADQWQELAASLQP